VLERLPSVGISDKISPGLSASDTPTVRFTATDGIDFFLRIAVLCLFSYLMVNFMLALLNLSQLFT
jgi:hypothetical protein